ncbi:general secretion pathway protein I [Hyphomonas polymorpha PS728]|uniref:Type II secretion system protein I n=1 Tax=Hyphomonas polymorpha PS728 TaxID=1280954 RepID=A0A062VKV7_9PROT|nr:MULTISPECIES: type II secretion system minor pseudopilin GspI [Hyphomonas]KCZ99267.1 general secretion pathway protein I [Hyphomonas polymorpha PS728]
MMGNQQGFTLMEALVAVAVFATAAMGLISLNTSSLRISAQMGDRALARQVAENVAVETITNPELQVIGRSGGQEVQRGRSFVWQRDITPAPRDDVVEVSIRVRAADEEAVLSEVALLHRIKADR